MVTKKVVRPLKPKKSKKVISNIEKIISGPKRKTRQVVWKEHLRLGRKVRKHTKTKVVKK